MTVLLKENGIKERRRRLNPKLQIFLWVCYALVSLHVILGDNNEVDTVLRRKTNNFNGIDIVK